MVPFEEPIDQIKMKNYEVNRCWRLKKRCWKLNSGSESAQNSSKLPRIKLQKNLRII